MTIIPEELAIKKPKKHLLEKMNKTNLKEKVLFKKDTDFHAITVVENDFGRFIKYEDTYQAGFIKDEYYNGNLPYINYFLIPYLINPNIKNILFVGLGTGIILQQYKTLFKSLKKVDIVDIEEYIFPIAEKYFDFKIEKEFNFYLQDALIFLKNTKQKYDLIVVDVAGNEGIDERFTTKEYLNLVKKHLTKQGVFVANMPSATDIFNKKNKFVLNLIQKYNETFQNIKLYDGKTSNKIFYKVFFNTEEDILNITNLIIISSEKEIKLKDKKQDIEKMGINITKYLQDVM